MELRLGLGSRVYQLMIRPLRTLTPTQASPVSRLLPIIVEHTIDEQSPLCGQNHDSLMHVSSASMCMPEAEAAG